MHLERPSGPLPGHHDPGGHERAVRQLALGHLQRFSHKRFGRAHGHELLLDLHQLVLEPTLLGLRVVEGHGSWRAGAGTLFDRPHLEDGLHLVQVPQHLADVIDADDAVDVDVPLHFATAKPEEIDGLGEGVVDGSHVTHFLPHGVGGAVENEVGHKPGQPPRRREEVRDPQRVFDEDVRSQERRREAEVEAQLRRTNPLEQDPVVGVEQLDASVEDPSQLIDRIG